MSLSLPSCLLRSKVPRSKTFFSRSLTQCCISPFGRLTCVPLFELLSQRRTAVFDRLLSRTNANCRSPSENRRGGQPKPLRHYDRLLPIPRQRCFLPSSPQNQHKSTSSRRLARQL